MKTCPFCSTVIQPMTGVCKHCGRDLAAPTTGQAATVVPRTRPYSPAIAAVLSLVIPGAGQMYCGRVGTGMRWLVAVMIGYVARIVPGAILHVICICSAALA